MMLIVLLMMSYLMILVINGSRTYLILQADLQRGNHQEQVHVHIFVVITLHAYALLINHNPGITTYFTSGFEKIFYEVFKTHFL